MLSILEPHPAFHPLLPYLPKHMFRTPHHKGPEGPVQLCMRSPSGSCREAGFLSVQMWRGVIVSERIQENMEEETRGPREGLLCARLSPGHLLL